MMIRKIFNDNNDTVDDVDNGHFDEDDVDYIVIIW